MKKCKKSDCDLGAVEGQDFCILHCIKGDYQDDKLKNDFLNSFFLELIDYIVQLIISNPHPGREINQNHIKAYFKDIDIPHPEKDFIKSGTIVFTEIIFPARDSRDNYDYEKILEKLGSIHFNGCEFYVDNLDLEVPKVFFQDCIFHTNWFLYNHKVLESANNVIYQTCKFKEDVNTVSEDYSKPELDNAIFRDCEFEKSLTFDSLVIKDNIFKNSPNPHKIINIIHLFNCTVESKFCINQYEIQELKCETTQFLSKFEVKRNTVNSLKIINSNFSNIFDCYGTTCKNIHIEKCIYKDYVGFQDCNFGIESNSENSVSLFKYVTFLSFVNFRNAKFFSGLDIKDSNFKDPPNFLGIFVSFLKTNRETFRVIKYSFDRVGNYIDANLFYILEMKKYKEELKIGGNRSNRLLLSLYEITSNYGQSFGRPIISILITSLLYYLTIQGFENNLLYSIEPSINPIFLFISNILNTIAKGILPFKKILLDGMEFLSLLFYITFTSLIWLFILAIKRTTKR